MMTENFQNLFLAPNTNSHLPATGSVFSGLPENTSGAPFPQIFAETFSKGVVNHGSSPEKTGSKGFFDLSTIKGSKERKLAILLLKNLSGRGNKVTVNGESLRLLKGLLKSLNFDEKSIQNLMGQLNKSGQKKGLSIGAFLEKINTFLTSKKTHNELAMSATPFIESILIAMGMKPEAVEHCLKKSWGKKGGIDIQALTQKLAEVPETAFQNPSEKYLTLTPTNQNLLKGIGMPASDNGRLSMDRFIQNLKDMMTKTEGTATTEGASEIIAKKFGASIAKTSEQNNHLTEKRKNTSKLSFNNNVLKKQERNLESSLKNVTDGKKHDLSLSKKSTSSMKERPFISGEKEFSSLFSKTEKEGASQNTRTALTLDGVISTKGNVHDLPAAKEKTMPAYLTNQVGRQIVKAVRDGSSEIRFQVKPPDMGRLQISLEFTRNGMKVGILAENATTRDLLNSNTHELRSVLADQGLRLEKVNVDVSGHFQHSFGNSETGFQHFNQQNKNRSNAVNNTKEDVYEGAITTQLPPSPVRNPWGGLSLVV